MYICGCFRHSTQHPMSTYLMEIVLQILLKDIFDSIKSYIYLSYCYKVGPAYFFLLSPTNGFRVEKGICLWSNNGSYFSEKAPVKKMCCTIYRVTKLDYI